MSRSATDRKSMTEGPKRSLNKKVLFIITMCIYLRKFIKKAKM